MTAHPKFGESTYLGVYDSEANGDIYDFEVDAHPGVYLSYEELVRDMQDSIRQHGGKGCIYLMAPISIVTKRKVKTSTGLEQLAKVAVLVEL